MVGNIIGLECIGRNNYFIYLCLVLEVGRLLCYFGLEIVKFCLRCFYVSFLLILFIIFIYLIIYICRI